MIEISHVDLMHATPAARPHSRPGWVYELKYDGFRCLAVKRGAGVRLVSRRGRDMAMSFPEVADELRALEGDFAIDGELVVQVDGREDFGALVGRLATRKRINVQAAARRRPACLFAFDLLSRWDQDLRGHQLLARKAELEELVAGAGRLVYVQHIEGKGLELYGQVRGARPRGDRGEARGLALRGRALERLDEGEDAGGAGSGAVPFGARAQVSP